MHPEWLAKFNGKVTDIETTVIVTSGDEVEQKVISGDVDLGFVAHRPRSRSFAVSVLAEDSLVLAVQKGHPLAARSSVRLDDLNKEQFIVRGPESASPALTEKRVSRTAPTGDIDCRSITSMQSRVLLKRASESHSSLSGR
jgi:DNA-binding transcriptional LysR family regulator